MIVVGQGDITVWQGANAPPVIWEELCVDIPDDQEAQSGDFFDLTGSVVWLTIYFEGAAVIAKNTTDDAELVLDAAIGRVTWTPTLAGTRSLPLGRKADYELERRIDGNQEPMAAGFVIVLGGHNRD